MAASPSAGGVVLDGMASSSMEGPGLAEAPSLSRTGPGSEGADPSPPEESAEASRQLLHRLHGSVDGVDTLSGNFCRTFLRTHRKNKTGLRNGLGTLHYQALLKEMLLDSQS